MMKYLTDLCCGLILMALPGGGNGPEDWQNLFTQQYATMQTAMSRRDTATLGAMLTPDFVAYDIDGMATSASQWLADSAAQSADSGRVMTTQLLTVNIQDFKNAARVVHRDIVRIHERDGDGRTHDLDFITIRTDDWVRLYSVWQLRHRETAVYDQFLDGKKVVHKMRGDPATPPVSTPAAPPPPAPPTESPFGPKDSPGFPHDQ